MKGKVRRFPTYIYYDTGENEVAQKCGAWNLEDAPPGFDFLDFHKRVWELIWSQRLIYGHRVIEYDRYGNLYGIRRPHDQAEWDELHDRDNPKWKRELEAEQEGAE